LTYFSRTKTYAHRNYWKYPKTEDETKAKTKTKTKANRSKKRKMKKIKGDEKTFQMFVKGG